VNGFNVIFQILIAMYDSWCHDMLMFQRMQSTMPHC